jgi:RND family efflux transporter MFP subunit
VLAVVWLSGGCGERIEPLEAADARPRLPDDAATETVAEMRTPAFEPASGTISSSRHAAVSAKTMARIEEILVRAGSQVESGALLVRLDARELSARSLAAKGEVASARASLELARTENARAEGLHAAGVAPQAQLDRARSTLRVAQAQLEGARQRQADADAALSQAEIRSPVAGRVVDRLAEPGDTAVPGTPLLRIYDPSALRLEVATRLSPGLPVRVRIEALGRDLQGEVDEIVPYAEPGARAFLVKVRLPPDPGLYAGMFGRVELPIGERTQLLIPSDAVERVGQLEFVRVVDAERRSERRLVTTGESGESGRIEILSGLRGGEQIVLAPLREEGL